MTIIISTRDEQFRAHCPNCSSKEAWHYLADSNSGDCVGRICGALVNTPPETCNYTMATGVDVERAKEMRQLFKQARIVHLDEGKRARVRALVLAFIVAPQRIDYSGMSIVQAAAHIDAEIEKL